MATNTIQKLAVLIDADNAQASVIQELLAEVSRYGTATIKRVYGDWTTARQGLHWHDETQADHAYRALARAPVKPKLRIFGVKSSVPPGGHA